MSSLYHIENELQLIFDEIEENEGELTPELLAKLDITKENLHKKLDNYVKAIKTYNGDIVTVKDEVKRLTANAKTKENRVEKLKAAMLHAVLLFGDSGKTNKFVDLPTVKVFTKGSEAVVTEDPRIEKLIAAFAAMVVELSDNNVLYTGQDVELQGVLDAINANLKAEHESDEEAVININRGEEFIPYTLADLTTLKIEITTTRSVYDLFRGGRDTLKAYSSEQHHYTMRNHTAKDDWKTAVKIADKVNNDHVLETGIEEQVYSYPSVAKVVKNNSIQFK